MFYGKKFMDRMGWGQQDIADRLGCAQSRVSDLNSGSRDPKYSELLKLIDLGITLEELFGKEAAEKLRSREPLDPSVMQRPEFQQNIHDVARQMLIDSMSQTLDKLKSDGPKPPQK